MPRPRKCRKVCCLPTAREFMPVNGRMGEAAVVMTVDEYETIRLIDKQGFSQEECGAYMKIARTTVQMIYTSARKKLADALVDGVPLKIEGGEYQLCDGLEAYCGCGGCRKHSRRLAQNHAEEGERMGMKIIIPVDEDQSTVCVVFGRAPYFLVYDTGSDEKEYRENPGASAEGGAGIAAAQFVVDCQADVLITVRCGENSAEVLKEAGIQIYKSEGASVDGNLTAFKEKKLAQMEKFHAGFQGNR